MSLWGSIKHAAHSVAKTVANATESAVNTVTEVVADTVESVGNAVEERIDKVADAAGHIPVIGGALQAAGHYLGNIVGSAGDFAATTIKAGGNLLGSIIGGGIKIGFGV